MAGSRRKHLLKNGFYDTLSALFCTALVVAVAVFGFRQRAEKHKKNDTQKRPGSQLITLSQLSENERDSALRWYDLQDPTIPARGNSGVGFSVMPGFLPKIVSLKQLHATIDAPEKQPDMPTLPPLDPMPDLSLLPPKDLSALPPRKNSDAVILYQSDGSLLPCPGLFADIPAGKAVRSTVIRIIPAGGGQSILLLAEKCGDDALDSYARRELGKIKFDAGNVVVVCWPSSVRKK